MIRIYDTQTGMTDDCGTLADAMALLVARYPEAVFSDIAFEEECIWVWPSNTASMHANPGEAVAWLEDVGEPTP